MRINVPITLNLTIVEDPFFRALLDGLDRASLPALFPATQTRLMQLAQKGRAIWSAKASEVPGAEGRPLRLGTGAGDRMVQLNRTAFINSLAIRDEEDGGVVVYSQDPQAECLEFGTPDGVEINLHKVLAYAPKARMSEAGKRYLRIPFRHATTAPGGPGGQRFQSSQNVIPPAVLKTMQQKSRYLMTGTHQEPSVNYPGQKVTRFLYTPHPGRLKAAELERAGIPAASTEGQRMLGMLRTGQPRHTKYLVFRTLSEMNDRGWRVPAYQAQHLAKQTADELSQLAANWFDEALQMDAMALVEQAQR